MLAALGRGFRGLPPIAENARLKPHPKPSRLGGEPVGEDTGRGGRWSTWEWWIDPKAAAAWSAREGTQGRLSKHWQSIVLGAQPPAAHAPTPEPAGAVPHPEEINLRDALPRCPPLDHEVLEAVYRRRGPLRVDRALLQHLARDLPEPEPGDEFRRRQARVHALLLGEAMPDTLEYTWLRRNWRRGRRLAYWSPTHTGRVVADKAGFRDPPDGLQLQVIAKRLRPAFRAPPGRVLLDADVRSCFLVLAARVTGDEQLASDLRDDARDVHLRTGELVAPGSPRPREIGKLLNNSLVGGLSASGLATELGRFGVACDAKHSREVWQAWWGRYPRLKAWCDDADATFERAREAKRALDVLLPDGSQIRFFGKMMSERDSLTVRAAVWQALESQLLDRAMVRLHASRNALDVQLVVPMYDGALFSAPEGRQSEAEAMIRKAFDDAGSELLGSVVPLKVAVDSTWR